MTKTATTTTATKQGPKCWQCKRPTVWVAANTPGRPESTSRLWTPKFQCPGNCGPQALAAMFGRVR